MRTEHPFAPLADERSRVLVLGSFPSLRSVDAGFYYAHPRNQFWPILAQLYDCALTDTPSRRRFALQHGLALWDVYASLIRANNNSSDANLTAMEPNDMEGFLAMHPRLSHIFCTGRKAYDGYRKHFSMLAIACDMLPSSSPAYAAMNFEAKCRAYQPLKEVLDAV